MRPCVVTTVLFVAAMTAAALKPANGDEIKLDFSNKKQDYVQLLKQEPPDGPGQPQGEQVKIYFPIINQEQSCVKTDAKCVYQNGGHLVYNTYVIQQIVSELVEKINKELNGISDKQEALKTKVIEDIGKVLTKELAELIVAQAAAEARDQLFKELRSQGVIR